LLALNHFTVPCSFTMFSIPYFIKLSGASRQPLVANEKRPQV
jgi:hypothetical protein